MNRADLQQLARLRIEEAKVLLDNACFAGAYYLAGYAVECALKACIAKLTTRYDFPNKELATKSYTHDLTNLAKLAGLELALNKEIQSNKGFERNWAAVKDWSEDARYRTNILGPNARDLYSAIVSRKDGVLTWLKKRW